MHDLELIAKIWRDHTDCTWKVENTEVGPMWSCGIIHQPTTRDRHMAALVMTQIEADRSLAAHPAPTADETRTPSDPRTPAARWYDKGYAAGRESVTAPPVTVTDDMVERTRQVIEDGINKAHGNGHKIADFEITERIARAALSAALTEDGAE